VAALAALLGGSPDASAASEAAYTRAIGVGGEALVAAAPLMAWSHLRAGRPADALALADALERALGPGHRLARVHGALIRVAAADADPTLGDADRGRRRLRDLRAGGFAAVERLMAKVLDGGSAGRADQLDGGGSGDRVTLLGEHTVRIGRRRVDRSAWKSKKAFEVLTVVALAGSRGMTREAVIENVWPARPPDKGRTLLRTALSEIRRVLEPDRPAGEPSTVIHAGRDRLTVTLDTDLDDAERQLERDAGGAFDRLAIGLAPELANVDWAAALVPRIDRLAALAAGRLAGDSDAPADRRIAALERLIEVEPWQRAHFDSLATLHRELGDPPAAAAVERRWFDA
jgi:DNA-binding SARP family transcriptional activator